jgi:predicted nucleic acid-binding protein
MIARIFVDTNVFVYSIDQAQTQKRRVARDLLTYLAEKNVAVYSTQVVQEFYYTMTHKLKILVDDAIEIISKLTQSRNLYSISGQDILDAAKIRRDYSISFWDGLIISAARSLKVDLLLSEDMQNGAVIGGITIKNPFSKGFKIEESISLK